MCQRLLRSASFHSRLQRIDTEIADDVCGLGCQFCGGGTLHVSNYPRKPRGGPPAELEGAFGTRLSFCCAGGGGGEGECRRRTTPPSVRFLGRRVYLGVVVILVTTLMHGLTEKRAAVLRRELGVSGETVERWRRWWLEEFPTTSVWPVLKGDLAAPIDESRLPASILERFEGGAEDGLVRLLKRLSPLTTSWTQVVSREGFPMSS